MLCMALTWKRHVVKKNADMRTALAVPTSRLRGSPLRQKVLAEKYVWCRGQNFLDNLCPLELFINNEPTEVLTVAKVDMPRVDPTVEGRDTKYVNEGSSQKRAKGRKKERKKEQRKKKESEHVTYPSTPLWLPCQY